jgi:hypothetical protein
VLVEPARNLYARLATRFAGQSNVRVVGDTLQGAMAQGSLPLAAYDSVVLINVLEHVKEDVELLRAARTLLRDGGALLLFVPALPWLFGSLDRLVGHERRYTASSLEAVVARAGFRLESTRYVDILGVLPWFVTGRVLRARRFDEMSARIYDRVVVPLGRLLEQRLSPRWGKNLSCVARVVRDSS